MYILKNAIKSITRAKFKNILIGILVIIISTTSCIALSIKNTATDLISSYKESNKLTATLSMQRENIRNNMKEKGDESSTPTEFLSSIETLTVDMIKDYANSYYVKDYNYNISINLNSSDITAVSMSMSLKAPNDVDTENMPENNNMPGGKNDFNKSDLSSGDFSLIGYSSIDSISEFSNSTYKIVDGSIFDSSTNNECIISNELAESNEININDTITFTNPNDENTTYSLKVVGIYEDSSESDSFNIFSNSANKIITTDLAITNILDSTAEDIQIRSSITPSFILKSKDYIEAFSQELESKGLSEYYSVSTNLDEIDESLQPIYNLSSFANIFLIIILSVGGAILLILNMLNIRERKYEIGVLRSIGMSKSKLLAQFIIESFIITMICLLLGILIGTFLTVPISNKLLESEIASMEEKTETTNNNFGFNGNSDMPNKQNMPGNDIRNMFSKNNNVTYVDKINTVVNFYTILQMFLVGLLLTLISSLISIISIARYKPLKILSNRA